VAVSAPFRTFVIEQLEQVVRALRWQPMFGGVGIYAGDRFFALIANDTLFFKVDDSTRPAFEAAGMEPFRPHGPGTMTIQYYAVPIGVLEAPDDLKRWAAEAIAAAERREKKGKGKR